MRAINHALTGAVIGLAVGEPAIAVPAALASHFVCDIIPHHGLQNGSQKYLRTDSFRASLVLDALLCGVLVSILALVKPVHWELASACAFLAASPDFFWLGKYAAALKNKKYQPGLFARFAGGIQWFQRPIGAYVEVAWFIAGAVLLAPFIR